MRKKLKIKVNNLPSAAFKVRLIIIIIYDDDIWMDGWMERKG